MQQKIKLEFLVWGPERRWALETAKRALMTAPALGLLDYSKPLNLYTHERKGIASGVIMQNLKPCQRAVANYSAKLDAVINDTLQHLGTLVAAATAVERSCPLILGHHLNVFEPHEVKILLKLCATQAQSPQ